MRKFWVATAILMGCSSVSVDAETAVFTRTQLVFADEDEASRFDRALACFGGAGLPQRESLEVSGNFIRSSWCTWSGSCSASQERDTVGARWASVGTLHYPRRGPEAGSRAVDAFGVQVTSGRRDADGYSVSVTASSNGKGVLGDHAFVRFSHAVDKDASFSIGLQYEWTIAEQTLRHSIGGDPWRWLAAVRTSPAALKEDALGGWMALHGKVVAALNGDEIKKCVYGPYGGDGIPPECVEQVPLSDEEKLAERKRIDDRLSSIQAAMANADTLHARLLQVAPTDCL